MEAALLQAACRFCPYITLRQARFARAREAAAEPAAVVPGLRQTANLGSSVA